MFLLTKIRNGGRNIKVWQLYLVLPIFIFHYRYLQLKTKEIRSLTGIRGVAALYVLVFHFFLLHTQPTTPPTSLVRNFLDNGYLSVDLFFVLSGYVITSSSFHNFSKSISWKNYLTFMKRRFARVYPAYVIIFVLATIFVTHFHPLTSIALSIFLISILSPREQVLGVFWSLSTEWIVYFIVPFWIRLTVILKKWRFLILLGIFLLCYSAFYFMFWQNYRPVGQIYLPYPFMRAIGSYSLGILAFEMKGIKVNPIFTDVLCLVVVFCLLIYKLDIIIVFLSAVLIYCLEAEQRSCFSKFCSNGVGYWLGQISYSLYLVHQFILLLCQRHISGWDGHYKSMFFIIYLILSLLSAHLYNKYIEIPFSTKVRNYFTSH